MTKPLGRRTFLKTASAATGGVVFASLGCVGDSTDRLRSGLKGRLILREDEVYDAARRIWNGSIDRRPWAIARCVNPSDVRRCIDFARERELPIAVRAGGHHAAGFAMLNDGLVIDLSEWTDIDVDRDRRTARVAPGVLAGHMHATTHEAGLVLPTGGDTTVGLAGLTLGGGEGWLASKYGLTCDDLISAQVVTADGDLVRASETEKLDLLWALRGGGGNFGVVTSFEYRLHALTQVVAGFVAYPAADGPAVLRNWRDRMSDAPDDLSSLFIFVQEPEPMFLVGMCWTGPEEIAGKAIDPIRTHGNPLTDSVARISTRDLFSAPVISPGAGNYWRSHYMSEFPDEAIDMLVEHCAAATPKESTLWFWSYHGAFSRVAPTATAYPHRNAAFEMGIFARWPVGGDSHHPVGWARDFWTAMAPFATGGVYSNWLSDVDSDTSGAAFGVNLDRLAELKRRYDPANLFRANVNVDPETGGP